MYTYVDKKSFKLFFVKSCIDNLVCALMVKNLLSRFYLMKQKQGTFLEEFLGQKRLTRAKALPRLIQVVAFTDFGIGVLELLAAKQQQSVSALWTEGLWPRDAAATDHQTPSSDQLQK